MVEPDTNSGVRQGHTREQEDEACAATENSLALEPNETQDLAHLQSRGRLGCRVLHFMLPSRHTPGTAADLGSQRDRKNQMLWVGTCAF